MPPRRQTTPLPAGSNSHHPLAHGHPGTGGSKGNRRRLRIAAATIAMTDRCPVVGAGRRVGMCPVAAVVVCIFVLSACIMPRQLPSIGQRGNAGDDEQRVPMGGGTTRTPPPDVVASTPFRGNVASDVTDDYDKHFLIVSKEAKVAITLVPKVMITSISVAIETDECPGFPTNRCREFRENPNLLDDVGDLRNLTRVLFVRDPAERALSAYLNSDDNVNISINRRCGSRKDCTFARWVKELGRDRRASFRNVHFMPQTAIAQFDRMHYHYVLRISSPIDQRFFWTHLLGRSMPSRENTSSAGNRTNTYSHFTDEIMEDLVGLYLEDFLLWERVLGGEGTPRSTVDGGEETAYDAFNGSEMLKQRLRLGGPGDDGAFT